MLMEDGQRGSSRSGTAGRSGVPPFLSLALPMPLLIGGRRGRCLRGCSWLLAGRITSQRFAWNRLITSARQTVRSMYEEIVVFDSYSWMSPRLRNQILSSTPIPCETTRQLDAHHSPIPSSCQHLRASFRNLRTKGTTFPGPIQASMTLDFDHTVTFPADQARRQQPQDNDNPLSSRPPIKRRTPSLDRNRRQSITIAFLPSSRHSALLVVSLRMTSPRRAR